MLVKSGKIKDIDAVNEDSFTPLHLAVYYNSLAMVKVLVEQGGGLVRVGGEGVVHLRRGTHRGQGPKTVSCSAQSIERLRGIRRH